jgi:hypothetical protein
MQLQAIRPRCHKKLRTKVLKHPMNHWMIRSTLKPWNVYDSKKKWHVDEWRRTQNPIVCIKLHSSIHVLTWIFVQNMWSHKEIFSYEKKKMRVELEHWSCLLNKYVLTIETNSHWKYHIIVVNDCCKQIHDFVVVETHVIILPFGVILAYATIPNSPLPTKWSNQNEWLPC